MTIYSQFCWIIAFEFGCNAIDLQGIPESSIPILKLKSEELPQDVRALAYAPHEHPFYHDARITTMSQAAGDGYCRNLFQRLKATDDLDGDFNPNLVNHVWAHIQNGDCIANT